MVIAFLVLFIKNLTMYFWKGGNFVVFCVFYQKFDLFFSRTVLSDENECGSLVEFL